MTFFPRFPRFSVKFSFGVSKLCCEHSKTEFITSKPIFTSYTSGCGQLPESAVNKEKGKSKKEFLTS
jgi:hypothetical protein